MFGGSSDFFYPPAPAMPAPVPESVVDLLARYEKLLEAKAPMVLATLQPGLTDAEIDTLESRHAIKLTGDLRALYRWRNGTPRNASTIHVFPDHWFVPLDEALTDRDVMRKQVRALPGTQRRLHAAVAGHRDAWVGLIGDPAGDGYFYDPDRTEPEGSFFFCFAEDAAYVFYPAFRNYLAEVLAGYETGVNGFGQYGAETVDFEKANTQSTRFGAPNRTAEE
jgi:cell wall assembly regulator SMI1